MPRNRKFLLFGAAILIAGFLPWNVTAHAGWLCRRLGPPVEGLKITPGEVRWIPWSGLELSHLEVETRGGGLLHIEEVELRPRLWMLARGEWVTLWRFGPVRVDPDSWGIRQQPAREILSAGPAVDGGLALVRIERDRWVLEQLTLHGSLLQLNAKGWLARQRREGALVLKGELLGQPFTFSMGPQPERRP